LGLENILNIFKIFLKKLLLFLEYAFQCTFVIVDLLIYIVFGLGPMLETNQAFQPPTCPCPSNMIQKDKKWMKVGL